jgi:hypothetical protein
VADRKRKTFAVLFANIKASNEPDRIFGRLSHEGGEQFGDRRNAGREEAATLQTRVRGRFYLTQEARNGELTNRNESESDPSSGY